MKIGLASLLFASTLLFVGCGGGDNSTPESDSETLAITPSSIVGKVYYNTDTNLLEQDPNSYIKWVFNDSTIEETQYGIGAFSDVLPYEISGDTLTIDGMSCKISGNLTAFVMNCSDGFTLHFWDTLEKAQKNPDIPN